MEEWQSKAELIEEKDTKRNQKKAKHAKGEQAEKEGIVKKTNDVVYHIQNLEMQLKRKRAKLLELKNNH